MIEKTILITGASGFTGRHACQYFEEIGFHVAACVHRRESEVPYGHKIVCNMLNKDEIQAVIQHIHPDFVLHLAGKNSVQESWSQAVTYLEANLMGTMYFLDALRSLPSCRTLIVGSKLKSQLHHGAQPAAHPYSLSKTLQQLAVHSWTAWFSQSVMLAEPSNLIGPGPSTGICGLIAKKLVRVERGEDSDPFRLSSLDEVRDFVDVRDAVRAYSLILASGEPGRTYPIESGYLRSLGEVFDAFQQEARTPIPVVVTGQVVSGANTLVPVDLSWTQSLHWQPAIAFKDSVHDIVAHFRSTLTDNEVNG